MTALSLTGNKVSLIFSCTSFKLFLSLVSSILLPPKLILLILTLGPLSTTKSNNKLFFLVASFFSLIVTLTSWKPFSA